jgi:hypothetical protein
MCSANHPAVERSFLLSKLSLPLYFLSIEPLIYGKSVMNRLISHPLSLIRLFGAIQGNLEQRAYITQHIKAYLK